jgi:hypothetical protein
MREIRQSGSRGRGLKPMSSPNPYSNGERSRRTLASEDARQWRTFGNSPKKIVHGFANEAFITFLPDLVSSRIFGIGHANSTGSSELSQPTQATHLLKSISKVISILFCHKQK